MLAVRFFVFAVLIGWGGAALKSPSFGSEMEGNLPGKVAVGDLISYAYRKNPSIVAAREGWKAVVEDYRFTTGYPDPELNLTYYPEPIESRLGPLDWSASLNQKIPFPGKLTQAGKVVEAETNQDEIRIARALVEKAGAQVDLAWHENPNLYGQ